MAFDEVRLPEEIERGSQGGPSFSTTIISLSSGFEKRNVNWSRFKTKWNIGYGVRNRESYFALYEFFVLRQGKAYGFRFKDWTDFEAVDEPLDDGDGSTTQFQLQRVYSDAVRTYNRPIQKPVLPITVKVNGSETTDFTIDDTTGVITFDNAPANGATITWSGEFDVPVRFDTDSLDIDLTLFDAGSVPNIPIVEVPQELALG